MRSLLAVLTALVSLASSAAPAANKEPVAANYPGWSGVNEKNYVCGREICSSDLRHKTTIFIEVEYSDKFQRHLVDVSDLASMGRAGTREGENWEDVEMDVDTIAVVSVRNPADNKTLIDAMRSEKDQTTLLKMHAYGIYGKRDLGCPVYKNVTYSGAADVEGKCPYVSVFGPTGKTPIIQGTLTPAFQRQVAVMIEKARKERREWDPKWSRYTGNLAPEKVSPALAKALAKGKGGKTAPLEPVAKGFLKDVLSADEEVARAAQVQFDAIGQARSELLWRIRMEAARCPHRAAYDIRELVAYFPAEKKRIGEIEAMVKSKPEYEALSKIYGRVRELTNPDLQVKTASQAKKLMAELDKMKKRLATLKESADIAAQNGALVLDMKLDALISSVSAKIPAK